MNVVIMAGGGGTRLWPLSRKEHPKQFLKLDGEHTLLELTYKRAAAVTSPDHIFVATLAEYADKTKAVLPDVPADHIFYEPQRRDTAPGFAAAAAQLCDRGLGEEPTIFMWADHVFTQQEAYIEDVKKIPDIITANPNSIVIVGHKPTYPETGFGYIEVGEAVPPYDDVFAVTTFKEKPDKDTAQTYLDSGRYFWNMGTISLRPTYLMEQLQEFEPELVADMKVFSAALKAGHQAEAQAAYGKAKKISIDYALLERAKHIFVVTGDYGWSDVGNWAAIQDVFGLEGDHMPHGHHVSVDGDKNYVYNTTNKAVSIIGLHNTIVVVTEDAVLITPKDKAGKVKDVVAKLEEDNQHKYL